MRALFPRWRLRADKWASLTFYQRFESLAALILTLVITLVILVALYRLIAEVLGGLVFGAMNPLEYKVFQAVFGQIMTVLIALEFNHTLQYVVSREQSIIQTKIVLLISLLALARKFIILDLKETAANELLGLAAAPWHSEFAIGYCGNATIVPNCRRKGNPREHPFQSPQGLPALPHIRANAERNFQMAGAKWPVLFSLSSIKVVFILPLRYRPPRRRRSARLQLVPVDIWKCRCQVY